MKSTNYYNTLIEVAEDCKATTGEMPKLRGDKKTVATLQFEHLFENPYKYTSDEVIFAVVAERKGYEKQEMEEQRQAFFSKGQPCLRCSPLTKRYGWGVHSDAEGRVAIFAVDSPEYQALLKDEKVIKTKAMRSARK